MGEPELVGVLDDSLRNGRQQSDETTKLLLEGKTVHVRNITNSQFSGWYGRYRTKHQRLLRRRLFGQNPEEGYIVWLEPEEGAAQ